MPNTKTKSQSRVVRAPRGNTLRCKGWVQEAALRMLMGEKFEELRELLSKKNPAYVLTGPQGDFVRSLAGTL